MTGLQFTHQYLWIIDVDILSWITYFTWTKKKMWPGRENGSLFPFITLNHNSMQHDMVDYICGFHISFFRVEVLCSLSDQRSWVVNEEDWIFKVHIYNILKQYQYIFIYTRTKIKCTSDVLFISLTLSNVYKPCFSSLNNNGLS